MDFMEGKRIRVKHGYYYCGKKLFHRMIWEHFNGPIPTGFCVHHKDGNKLNNSIENLECMKISDHMRLHAESRKDELSESMKVNSEKIHAWLHNPEGKKFLSEKCKKEWEKRPLKTFICENCKKEFQTKHNRHVKYCGDNCVMRARNSSGIDNIERSCVICSKLFVINRYQKTVTCSFLCRNLLISRKKSKNYFTQ
jgi:uncharacterized protein YlaI